MKKSTKGAVAAAAAGVLLLGGAGSLAYWTADGVADGGEITAGTLTLTDGTCDEDGFVYAPGAAGAGTAVDLFVPGDEVTTTCTFTIGATGDNLAATLSAPDDASFTADGVTVTAPVVTSYTVDGVAAADGAVITDENNGDEVVATFNATIDYGTADDPFGAAAPTTPGVNGNLTQGITAALSELTVTLTQVDPNAGP